MAKKFHAIQVVKILSQLLARLHPGIYNIYHSQFLPLGTMVEGKQIPETQSDFYKGFSELQHNFNTSSRKSCSQRNVEV